MKNELSPVSKGDIIILVTGEIMYVMDVDPINKLNQDDKNRNCNCRLGHIYKSGEQYKKNGMFLGMVEDARHHQVISIDVSKSKNFTLAELIPLIATNLGKVTDEKIRNFDKLSSDYFDSTSPW